MKISVVDGSNYFKGLLLLLRKDGRISQAEIDVMKRIGETLGFERGFCDNAIGEILENTHIVDTPPVFSTKELAIKFVKDGLVLAFCDNDFHPLEEQWLRSTAEINGLEVDWFARERDSVVNKKGPTDRLEADDLRLMYT